MNILLITIDAWRASHASFNPGSDPTYTPTLAAFAETGTVFTQAVSHGPSTPYAFPAVFSSSLPLDYGGYERLSDERVLLSEVLSTNGYRCVGVHGNPWLGGKYGYARGYDEYRDIGEFSISFLDSGREVLIRRFGLDHPVYRMVQYLYRYASDPIRRFWSGTSEVDVALEALDSAVSDQFTWVHILTPHAPYTPPARHRAAVSMPAFSGSATTLVTRAQHDPERLTERERAVVRGLYAASVRHADEQVGRLLERVPDDTLVIVTADHGEALFDHGQLGHEPALYDELIRVPLLVRPPGGRAGSVDTQVRHIDIAPTILDYAGIESPASFIGRSLRPAIEGAVDVDQISIAEVASTAQTPGRIDADALQVSVRLPHRKLLYRNGTTVGFDLTTDATEQHPISDRTGVEWDPLKTALADRLASLDVRSGARIDYDPRTEERLRDLGYLD
ncbi:sulfatase [Haladaptatus sp. DYSN1]|uniref:sulfatase n=1 Tax=unclassified Haladaptatus TaxID=2622732 RepID=UPI0024062A03|nr:sulfatase [Haladaptatus sp. DYSN1]